MRPAPLLHAALQDLLPAMNRLGQRSSLLDGVGDRLLQVDIFAGCQGVDRHADMPVVRSSDEDSVDILRQDFVVIKMGGREPLGALLHFVTARPVDITHSDDLEGNTAGISGVEQISHAAAGADDTDADGVIRTKSTGGGQGGESTGNDEAAAICW